MTVKWAEILDQKLREMKHLIKARETAAARMEEELAPIRVRHQAGITGLDNTIAVLEGEILDTARLYHDEVFEHRDRVDLDNGALLYGISTPVKRVRTMLETLKEQGKTEAVKIAESVDWDLIETWTDEQLIEVGTERRVKEEYSYELKD